MDVARRNLQQIHRKAFLLYYQMLSGCKVYAHFSLQIWRKKLYVTSVSSCSTRTFSYPDTDPLNGENWGRRRCWSSVLVGFPFVLCLFAWNLLRGAQYRDCLTTFSALSASSRKEEMRFFSLVTKLEIRSRRGFVCLFLPLDSHSPFSFCFEQIQIRSILF